ncbi:glutamine-hydrolyzing GMP synthase [soil metagenome]
MIVVIDFGSQTANLIERRIRDIGVTTKFLPPEDALGFIKQNNVDGIILSGGPSSVYDEGSPTIDPEIFKLGIPIFSICYGTMLMMQLNGGKVISGKKEYGPAVLTLIKEHALLKGIAKTSTVWMSHGDEIIAIPESFTTIASSDHVPHSIMVDDKKKFYGLLFHPEVEHTEFGDTILKNFIELTGTKLEKKTIDIEKIIEDIRIQVGSAVVIGAVSGGVDSTVAAALTAKAIGSQFVPFHVDNGLMRIGTTDTVKQIFDHIGVSVDILSCEDEMLERLKGISDPEEKRKVIGKFYIDMFEREMDKLIASGRDVKFLLQGTIYSDVIESKGTKHASKIKSHHNVGGLPEDMKLALLEPLRTYYKDEVRSIGSELGLPDEFVWQQVFPGPGYGVRIRGELTKERLDQERIADKIVLDEIIKAGLFRRVFMSFAIMSGAESTAVKGDGRFFGEVVAVRVVESRDVMTSKWAHLPYEVLQAISSRIVNEVPNISRVVYDITTKPPATMEWE